MKGDAPRPPARRAHEDDGAMGSELAASASPATWAPGLAASWAAGTMTLDEVKRALVEQVVDAQLGTDAPADLREELCAALTESLLSDPFLQDQLRALAGR